MNNRIIYIIISLMSIVGISCKEEGRIDFIDDTAPAPVSHKCNGNRPGGAVLRYTLPKIRNLLYIRAEYESTRVIRETNRLFQDSLVLEGFGTPVQRQALFRRENGTFYSTINPATARCTSYQKFRDTFGELQLISSRIGNSFDENTAGLNKGELITYTSCQRNVHWGC